MKSIRTFIKELGIRRHKMPTGRNGRNPSLRRACSFHPCLFLITFFFLLSFLVYLGPHGAGEESVLFLF